MRPIIAILVSVSAIVFLQTSEVWAQTGEEHVISVGEVWKSVSDAPDVESAQRAQIMRVLQHPTTREIAQSYGLDLRTAENAVRMLDGEELQQLSARAALVESQLSGGGSLVITSTALIIILLIVILLVAL